MPQLKEIWDKTRPDQRFGNPELIAAIRREEEREERQGLIEKCQACDAHGRKTVECSQCDGSGEEEIDCEHEDVEDQE